MWRRIEGSALLRTLNFLRVRHPHRLQYVLLYPFFLSLIFVTLHYFTGEAAAAVNITVAFAPVLTSVTILFPFFVASLAAVATFQGPEDFDAPFRMHKPVTLLITHRGGLRSVDVSPRYFLSLLFGYVAIVSIVLLLALSAESSVDLSGVGLPETAIRVVKGIFLFLAAFLFSQVLLLTILAIYYLADFIHRLNVR